MDDELTPDAERLEVADLTEPADILEWAEANGVHHSTNRFGGIRLHMTDDQRLHFKMFFNV